MKRTMIYLLLLPLLAIYGCKGTTEQSSEANVFTPGELWPDN